MKQNMIGRNLRLLKLYILEKRLALDHLRMGVVKLLLLWKQRDNIKKGIDQHAEDHYNKKAAR